MRKALIAGSLVLAGFFLVGCADYQLGPPGKVSNNDRMYISHIWFYKITTEKDGKKTKFDVSSEVYYKCPRGAQYPKCTHKK